MAWLRALALHVVPHRWRAVVVRDLDEEAGAAGRRGLRRDTWTAWHAVRIGLGLRRRDATRRIQANGRRDLTTVTSEVRSSIVPALRSLRRRRLVFTYVALTAALGTAAVGAGGALYKEVLVRPPSFPGWTGIVTIDYGFFVVRSRPDRVHVNDELAADSGMFSSLGLYDVGAVNLNTGARIRRQPVGLVDAGFFITLGVAPVAGRTFAVGEDHRERSVVVAEQLWMEAFDGREFEAGQTIDINQESFEVIGVMPRTFAFPQGVAVWLLPKANPQAAQRGLFVPTVVARLAPGLEPRTAEEFFGRAKPRPIAGPVKVVPIHERMTGDRRPTIVLLGVVAGLLWLATVTTLASLVLVTLERRRREFGVRVALGASRAALIRQATLESALGVSIGACLGALAAMALLRRVPASLVEGVPIADLVQAGAYAAIASAVLTIAVGALVALVAAHRLVPGTEAARAVVEANLPSRARQRLRRGFAAAQVCLGVVTCSIALSAAFALDGLSDIDLGVRREGAVFAEMTLPVSRYGTAATVMSFVERLETELASHPGVTAAGFANVVPGASGVAFLVPVQEVAAEPPVDEHGQRLLAQRIVATPGYFAAAGIALAAGAIFDEHRRGGDGVVLVSQATARAVAGSGREAVGRRLVLDGDEVQIVGVVADVLSRGPVDPRRLQIYQPMAGRFVRDFLSVAIATDRPAFTEELRTLVAALDPELPLYNVRSAHQQYSAFVWQERMATAVGIAAAAVTVLLFSLGVYGLLAEMVALRERDLAIRLALGADEWQVAATVIGSAVAVVSAGVLAGVPLAVAGFGVISNALGARLELSNEALGLSVAALLVMGIAAAVRPAVVARSIHPSRVLRSH